MAWRSWRWPLATCRLPLPAFSLVHLRPVLYPVPQLSSGKAITNKQSNQIKRQPAPASKQESNTRMLACENHRIIKQKDFKHKTHLVPFLLQPLVSIGNFLLCSCFPIHLRLLLSLPDVACPIRLCDIQRFVIWSQATIVPSLVARIGIFLLSSH